MAPRGGNILAVGFAAASLCAHTRAVNAPFDTAVATRAAYYSAAAYCDPSQISNWSCKPCAANDVVHATALTDTKLDVHGYVGVEAGGNIVVAFRGTNPLSIQDWIDDIDAFPSTLYPGCPSCEVHQGFYDSYLGLSTAMYAALNAYGAMSAPAILVTGHSLGAAMASLATFELVLAGYPVATHIDFGRPRVGNPAFAQAFEQLVMNRNASGFRMNDFTAAPRGKAIGRWSPVLVAAVRRAYEHSIGSVPHAARSLIAQSVLESQNGASRLTGRQARNAALKAARNTFLSALDFAKSLSTSVNNTQTFRVTHNADPVPHLPLELMGCEYTNCCAKGLGLGDDAWTRVDCADAHPPQEIWYNEFQTSYRTCSATNGEDKTCSDSLLVDLSIPDHLDYMNLDIALECGL